MKDNRDNIDFGREPIGKLFRGIFFPTLLGLFFGVVLNLADGVFVGRGVGSDALAAINIAAPFFMITSGIALLFGSGVSVVAAIHLGKGNTKAARINVTQAYCTAVVLLGAVIVTLCCFPEFTCHIFGGSARLQPLFNDYLYGIAPGLVACPIAFIGLFVLRLDGSPRLASGMQVGYSVLNIVLDYIFVFPCGFGLAGAAWATSVAEIAGAIGVIIYMLFFSKTLTLYRPKLSKTAVILYLRNVGYMMKVGFSTFLGEIAMTCVMICGNYQFIARFGEDGVAAFSVACYLFPLIFMVGQAIAQSAQPIVSYNLGKNDWERINSTRRLSYWLAIGLGITISLFGILATPLIASMFLGPCRAYDIACKGLPWYSIGFLFCTMNVVMIGYAQSLEKAKRATLYTLLRGFVFVVPAFMLLPGMFGDRGLWLAVPVSEALTLGVIIIAAVLNNRQRKPKRIMHEGKLLRSEVIDRNGEPYYVEKVAFKDWHVSLHSFYLISDRLCDGRHIVEQSWDYNDFCNITIRLDDCTYALVRQVECIAFARSFRSMPIDEFDNVARPLIM